MMNVDQITSRLAKLPDQALQQYAAMHKNDPYVLSLAVAESNRRKQLRQSAQAAQSGQEQPKVADQAVAEMAPTRLPEEQGIARLPAGEMNFADGGIVAFAGGGDVERYQVGGVMAPSAGTEYEVPGMVVGDEYRRAIAKAKAEAGQPLTDVEKALLYVSAPLAAAADVVALPITGLANLVRNPLDRSEPPSLTPAMDARRRALAAFMPDESGAKTAAPTFAGPGDRTAPRYPAAPMSGPVQYQTSASQAAKNAPAAKEEAAAAEREERTSAAPRTPGAAPQAGGFDMSQEGLMALREKLGREVQVKEPEDLRAAREALTAEKVNAARENKAAIERSHAKFADAFKGREERLTKREEELGKQKDTNTGLAFLNAGLAIMSTPGGLAQAIGKGARVGTEQYAAGLEKLQAAKDKLNEARDRLDDLKLNRDMLNDKEIREAEAGIRAATIEGRERGVDALKDMFNISNKRADSMFGTLAETGLTMYREQQANARNANSVAAQTAALKARENETAKIRSEYGKLQAKVMELLSKDQEYQTASPAQKTVMYNTQLRQAMLSNPFLAGHAGNIGFSATPTGGKTYDLTDE